MNLNNLFTVPPNIFGNFIASLKDDLNDRGKDKEKTKMKLPEGVEQV